METISGIKKEIEVLKERNIRVEMHKAWETSLSRKLLLTILTYIIAGITLHTIKNPSPWTNALIPAIGFFLSTLTLPFIRNLWEKYIYKK